MMEFDRLDTKLPSVSRATTRLSTNTHFSSSPPLTPISFKLPPVSKQNTQLTNIRSKSMTSSVADTRHRKKKRKAKNKIEDKLNITITKVELPTEREELTDRLSRIDGNNNYSSLRSGTSRSRGGQSQKSMYSTNKSLYRSRAISRQATGSTKRPATNQHPPNSRHQGRSLPPKDNRKHCEEVVKRRDSLNEGMIMESKFIQRVNSEEFVTNRYDIDKCLGQGNFAVVSKCKDKSDATEWALKEIDIAQLHGKGFCIENEADLMFRYRHDNVCFLREALMTPNTYYLVLEMATDGDLFDTIKRDGPMPETRMALIISQAAEALRYLHRHKIVHRDIKPENLLLTNGLTVKLTDFGLACRALGNLYRVCGTPTYVAPEVLSEIGYGKQVDMWSLGVITYILLCGYAPFRSGDRDKLFKLIQDGALVMSEKHWLNVSEDTKTLVRRMLEVDVPKRLTAKQLLKSRWLKRMKLLIEAENADLADSMNKSIEALQIDDRSNSEIENDDYNKENESDDLAENNVED